MASSAPDLTHAVLKLFKLALALGVADLLEDDLLGRLRGDAAELDRGQRIDNVIADDRTLLELLGFLQVDLLEIVIDRLDHFDDAPQAQIAGDGVELRTNVVLGTVAGAGGALDRVFHRFDDDALVDHLLGRDGIRNGDQLGAVGGNARGSCGGHQFSPSSSVPSGTSSSSISSAPSSDSGRVAAISASVSNNLAVPTCAKLISISPCFCT